MLPILQLGPFAVQVPGLMLLAGIWAGIELSERWAERCGVSPAAISNLVFFGLIAGVVGARLGYVLRFLSLYLEDPLGVLALNPNTLSAPEGALAGVLVAVIYGQRRRLHLWDTLDALAPGVAAFAVAIGVAHFASGDAFGQAANLPWAIELWGARRHPTQLYEIALAGLALYALWRLRDQRPFSGAFFLSWLAMYGALQLFVGGLRGDSVIVLGALRRGQLLGLSLLLAAMLLLHLRARGRLQPDRRPAEGSS